MQRRLLFLSILSLLAASCSRQAPVANPRQVEVAPEKENDPTPPPKPPVVPVTPVEAPVVADDHKNLATLVARITEPGRQDRYDARLLEALDLLADKKYKQALQALETARTIQDSESIQREIARVKALFDQQTAAEQTTRDIRTVLTSGKPEDAAQLSVAALQQFGGGDAASKLIQLKKEADAVSLPPAGTPGERRLRLLREARAAVADGNLRAAVIAFEQAQALGDDPDAQRQLNDLRSTVTGYDDQRELAARLRRDSRTLADAVSALQQAQKAWDTPQVRMELDEYTFALQHRRDRLSVADFEVRGDVGQAQAGQALAEELLPNFKSRFDLVERQQVHTLIGELKLETSNLTDGSEGRQELGRLARIRYLVMGSVQPLDGGVTAHARLVEVGTGLVAQTARLSAPTMGQLMKRLPQLAQMLMMNDDQRMALEQSLAQQAADEIRPIEPPAELPPLPPVPDLKVPLPALPPLVTYSARPIPMGGLTILDFAALPPIVLFPPPPPPEMIVIAPDAPVRRRLFALALELGDNLFRRRRFAEAHRHFQVALSYGNDQAQTPIQARIDQCRPFLPPAQDPTTVVGLPRPRLVVFNFLVKSDPGLVPLGTGDWAADTLGGYFGSQYDLVDRGQVSWTMGRLGITMRDVLNNPSARIALAQALNVRSFVFGAIVQTTSFDVSTHLLDAQSGTHLGMAMIHVQDHQELKLRVTELAQQLGAPTDQQAQLKQKGRDNEKVINQTRNLIKAGQHAQAIEAARTALKTDLNNIALQTLLHQAEHQEQQARLETQRKTETARLQADQVTLVKQRLVLVQKAEAARKLAETAEKTRTDASRREQEARQQKAYETLRAAGEVAFRKGDYSLALQCYQSAAGLKAGPEVSQDVKRTQDKLVEQQAAAVAREKARQLAEMRKAQEIAQAKIEQEQRARKKAQEARDQAEADRLVTQAENLRSKGKVTEALALAQSARQLYPSPKVNLLVTQLRQDQDLAEARKKSEAAALAAKKRLEEEQAKQETYQKLLDSAQKAAAANNYDEALKQYDAAGKLILTEAVLTGKKNVQQLKDQALAEQKRQADLERVRKLVSSGRDLITKKDLTGAGKALVEAQALAPRDPAVVAALGELEAARKPSPAETARLKRLQEDYKLAMDSAKDAMNKKNYQGVINAAKEALRLMPGDAAATALSQQAQTALSNNQAEEMRKKADFTRLVSSARNAIAGKKYADAIRNYTDALKLYPNDAEAKKGLADAQQLAKPSPSGTTKPK